MTTSETAQRSKDLIRQLLLEPPSNAATDPFALFCYAADVAKRVAWVFDWNAALHFWSDLARAGVISLLGDGSSGYGKLGPSFLVTERGRKILAEDAPSPYDTVRFLGGLRERVPDADSIVLAYVEEATGALQARLYRSCIVTLGCACERLVVMLAEAVRDSGIEPGSNDLRKRLASDRPAPALTLFTRVRDCLLMQDLPLDLRDAFDLKLTPIFERARALRNRHGHPTGVPVDVEEAEAGLRLFPGFYAFVERLRAHLSTRQRS